MACWPSSPTGESAVDPFCWTCQMSLFCAISSWFLKGLSSGPSRCCGVLHGRTGRALLTVPTATLQGVLQRALLPGGGQAHQHGQPSSKESWAEVAQTQLSLFWLCCRAALAQSFALGQRWCKEVWNPPPPKWPQEGVPKGQPFFKEDDK